MSGNACCNEDLDQVTGLEPSVSITVALERLVCPRTWHEMQSSLLQKLSRSQQISQSIMAFPPGQQRQQVLGWALVRALGAASSTTW